MVDLNALADFNLVAQHGGFSPAARASGRAKATLSRHLAELEEALGLRLIDRDGRGFRLTEAGQVLRGRIEAPLADMAEAVAGVTHDLGVPRGRLRVSSPLMFGHLALGRVAAAFAQAYPEVQLEVTVEDRKVDLIEEGYDVVIRTNPSPDSGLVGRVFLRDELLVVAPAGMARPVEGPAPAVTGLSAPDLQERAVVAGNVAGKVALRSVLRLPSPLMVRDAVLAGAGAAVLPRRLVAAALAEGRLQEWGRLPDGQVELWALHASRRLASRKVAAFIDMLVDQAALD